MPDEWPELPGHERVREWFEHYADAFDFRHRIATGTEVESAVAEPGGDWNVTLRGPQGERSTRRYQALIAASGNYWYPKAPASPSPGVAHPLH